MGKRGVKICPQCGAENGARSFLCKNCDYNFKPGQTSKTVKKPSTGLGRGKKLCPQCNKTCGPRSFVCPHCDYNFKPGVERKSYVPVNKRLKKNEEIIEDWRSLKLGTKIRVLKNSGSYYMNEEGEKIYMQDPGVYMIKSIGKDGLGVYGDSGFGYVYMGDTRVSHAFDSIMKSPCSIALVKEK